jgi:hypothetical protein
VIEGPALRPLADRLPVLEDDVGGGSPPSRG